jgi:CubicO group peptidase (beta-lactamase class C family)
MDTARSLRARTARGEGIAVPLRAPISLRADAQRARRRTGAPGVILFAKVGRQESVSAAGFSRLRPRRRARGGERFWIGSVTKTFTATIVLQLVAERLVAVDDPVSSWLPELPDNDPPAPQPHQRAPGLLPGPADRETARAGGVWSDARGVSRFFSALLGGELLGPAEEKEMLTVTRPSIMGLGIGFIRADCGRVHWGHGGATPGFATYALATRDGSTVVVAAANEGDRHAVHHELVAAAQRLFCRLTG